MSVSSRLVRTVEPPSLAWWRQAVAAPKPTSEQRVALSPAVRAAFECGHCLSDVIVPRVIVLHDETCPTMRRS
jgi:hypothetical protein